MASDLRALTREVHEKAREVQAFWFDALMPEQWFGGSPGLDREIADLFGAMRDRVLETDASGWDETPETLLAAILLLDQFSRNIHRGTAQAFAGDALAHRLALCAVNRGWDEGMTAEQRQFLYLPFEHAEDAESQARSLRCYEALGLEVPLAYARNHADVIRRFGRFPSRNAALGRVSTAEEIEYLSQPGAGW